MTATKSVAETEKPQECFYKYMVKIGDLSWRIAQKYEVTLKAFEGEDFVTLDFRRLFR